MEIQKLKPLFDDCGSNQSLIKNNILKPIHLAKIKDDNKMRNHPPERVQWSQSTWNESMPLSARNDNVFNDGTGTSTPGDSTGYDYIKMIF